MTKLVNVNPNLPKAFWQAQNQKGRNLSGPALMQSGRFSSSLNLRVQAHASLRTC